jgi:hypothetical protein
VHGSGIVKVVLADMSPVEAPVIPRGHSHKAKNCAQAIYIPDMCCLVITSVFPLVHFFISLHLSFTLFKWISVVLLYHSYLPPVWSCCPLAKPYVTYMYKLMSVPSARAFAQLTPVLQHWTSTCMYYSLMFGSNFRHAKAFIASIYLLISLGIAYSTFILSLDLKRVLVPDVTCLIEGKFFEERDASFGASEEVLT